MRTTSLPCGEVSRMRDLQIVCRSAWADFHLFSVTRAMQSKTDDVSFLSRRLVLTVSVALRDGCSGFYRAMLCIARTMPSQDVCLSVWLSVRLSHAGILSKRIYISSTFFTTGLPRHSRFPRQTVWQYSDIGPLTGGGRMQEGMKKSRFSTSISLYLGNDTIQSLVTMGGE